MKTYEKIEMEQIINGLAADINAWARGKGFWNIPDAVRNAMDSSSECFKFITDLIKVRKCALVTTETSEHVEAIRKPTPSGVDGFTNEEEEVADQIIRLLDYSGEYKLRIGECIAAKMAKNENRPYLHGKAF